MVALYLIFCFNPLGLISFFLTFNIFYWGSKIFIKKKLIKILFQNFFYSNLYNLGTTFFLIFL